MIKKDDNYLVKTGSVRNRLSHLSTSNGIKGSPHDVLKITNVKILDDLNF